jgi:hypothetical protein
MVPFDFGFQFMYTDKVDVKVESSSTEQMLSLLEIAYCYRVMGLVSILNGTLENHLNPENCLEIYERTALYSDLQLGSKALSLLKM